MSSLHYWLQPKYWPLWLGFTVMKGLTKLPSHLLLRTSAIVGRGFGRLARRRRRIASVNLALCFPDRSEAERRRLLDAHFAALGMGFCETALSWWLPDQRFARLLAEIKGLEHLNRALACGQGVLLLTGHFTTLELGARTMTINHPLHAMYRRHSNALYERVMKTIREQRSRLPALPRDDIRGVIKALKQGEIVWYAPDQNLRRTSVSVPFFGVPARTITATSRLARAGNARVVPYYPQRLADGRYRVTILPALEDFPSNDEIADTERINRLIESWVRQIPEQYLWVHRRFRTRRKDQPDMYV